ncbi:hypothetical protein [Rhizobium sp. P28RR-XV]|uniref:hypothetical protein n=1 Tax=Rhizobium sp. P28RR-XV TaxID=2726737 RepID=UPI001456E32B|nr:hypothetical protein [Rhizobium sp. P28RR-XV]
MTDQTGCRPILTASIVEIEQQYFFESLSGTKALAICLEVEIGKVSQSSQGERTWQLKAVHMTSTLRLVSRATRILARSSKPHLATSSQKRQHVVAATNNMGRPAGRAIRARDFVFMKCRTGGFPAGYQRSAAQKERTDNRWRNQWHPRRH